MDFFTPLNMLYVLLMIFIGYSLVLHIRLYKLENRLHTLEDCFDEDQLERKPRKAKHVKNG